ncbi:unnamed protein product [Brugia timori]|uniref:HTH_OrfB_IS605 domain-containing protein n=1 Tax=Brugia timori TaxID=42155 RepID=A0A0R3QE28_9BILA|nr:unnamed protein product [Brugia timori]
MFLSYREKVFVLNKEVKQWMASKFLGELRFFFNLKLKKFLSL